jgi:hypothetical protein
MSIATWLSLAVQWWRSKPKFIVTIHNVIHHWRPQEPNSMALMVEMEIRSEGSASCARDFQVSLLTPTGVSIARGRLIPIAAALTIGGIESVGAVTYVPAQDLLTRTDLIRRGERIAGVLWLSFAPFWLRVFSHTILQITFKDARGTEWTAKFPIVDADGKPNMLFGSAGTEQPHAHPG